MARASFPPAGVESCVEPQGGGMSFVELLTAETLAGLEEASAEDLVSTEDLKEKACSTLLSCIITTLNHGLRCDSGGGGGGAITRVNFK